MIANRSLYSFITQNFKMYGIYISLHHCFVSQTLSFMEQLLDYSRIVGEVLQGQSSFAVSSSDDQRNVVLGKFLSKSLSSRLKMQNLTS